MFYVSKSQQDKPGAPSNRVTVLTSEMFVSIRVKAGYVIQSHRFTQDIIIIIIIIIIISDQPKSAKLLKSVTKGLIQNSMFHFRSQSTTESTRTEFHDRKHANRIPSPKAREQNSESESNSLGKC